LEMIREDTALYPEHRVNFFPLLDAAIRNCFQLVVNLPEPLLTLIIQAVLWSMQHTIRSISELGISLIVELIVRLRDLYPVETRQEFYRRYFMEILTHVIAVVSDYNQVPFVGLTNLAQAVCELFASVEKDITVSLNGQSENSEYVYTVITELFTKHFPNLSKDQVRVAIKGFFCYNSSLEKMREHLRDFLVQIKEDAGCDTADLFLEEKEKEIQRIQEEKMRVPGIQNPNDIKNEEAMTS